MSALTSIVLATMPYVPKPVMRRLSSRYIAGEDLADALARLEGLAERGFAGILNLLGEHVRAEPEVRAVVDAFAAAARAIAERSLPAYVSVKPTHVGLEASEELALESYAELARICAARGLFLRVEMEDRSTTDATIRIFEALRRSHDNVGLVLQARLFRTPEDIDALAEGPLEVRMVKGIYLEPAEVAHTEPEPIRAAYLACTRRLFERGARVALATHDDRLADALLAQVDELGVPPERYEFQVLMGVREALWTRWRDAGHAVRVYVPYGPEWRAYSLRRMRENPEVLHHVLRATIGLGR